MSIWPAMPENQTDPAKEKHSSRWKGLQPKVSFREFWPHPRLEAFFIEGFFFCLAGSVWFSPARFFWLTVSAASLSHVPDLRTRYFPEFTPHSVITFSAILVLKIYIPKIRGHWLLCLTIYHKMLISLIRVVHPPRILDGSCCIVIRMISSKSSW